MKKLSKVVVKGALVMTFNDSGELSNAYSYNVCIAERQVDGTYRFDQDQYSQTTSRHQNIVRKMLLDAGAELVPCLGNVR